LEIIRKTLNGKVTKISVGLCAVLLLNACVGTKYLKEDEKLLYKQSVKVPKYMDKTGLNNDIYIQKANRRFLGLPINTLTWMYYLGLRRFEREHSWLIHSKNDFIRKKEKKEKKFDAKIAAATTDRKKANLQFRKQQKRVRRSPPSPSTAAISWRRPKPTSTKARTGYRYAMTSPRDPPSSTTP
jgi:hypothetical protein